VVKKLLEWDIGIDQDPELAARREIHAVILIRPAADLSEEERRQAEVLEDALRARLGLLPRTPVKEILLSFQVSAQYEPK